MDDQKPKPTMRELANNIDSNPKDRKISTKEYLTAMKDDIVKNGSNSTFAKVVEDCNLPFPTPTPNLDREIEQNKKSSGFPERLVSKLLLGVTFDTKDISENDICRVVHDTQKQLATLPTKASKTTERDI